MQTVYLLRVLGVSGRFIASTANGHVLSNVYTRERSQALALPTYSAAAVLVSASLLPLSIVACQR